MPTEESFGHSRRHADPDTVSFAVPTVGAVKKAQSSSASIDEEDGATLWRRLWLHERQGVGAGVAPAAVTERVVSRRTEWRCDRVPSAPFGVRATGEGDDRTSLAHVDAQRPNATRH